VLLAFFLLTERFNLRLMVLPLAAGLVAHIFALVIHYVFWSFKT